jgi:hypothetical protein
MDLHNANGCNECCNCLVVSLHLLKHCNLLCVNYDSLLQISFVQGCLHCCHIFNCIWRLVKL